MLKKLALAGSVALLATACGTITSHGASTVKPAAQRSQAQPAQPAQAAQPAEPAPITPSAKPNWKGSTVITAVPNDELGTILTNGAGKTLYRFDKDTPHPPVSNCFGPCAKLWPPLKFTKRLHLTGVDSRLIGNIMTKDGICQATLNGWPLYTYAKDTAPGQINGEGVGGTWFASSPTGGKLLPKTGSTGTGTGSGNGY